MKRGKAITPAPDRMEDGCGDTGSSQRPAKPGTRAGNGQLWLTQKKEHSQNNTNAETSAGCRAPAVCPPQQTGAHSGILRAAPHRA